MFKEKVERGCERVASTQATERILGLCDLVPGQLRDDGVKFRVFVQSLDFAKAFPASGRFLILESFPDPKSIRGAALNHDDGILVAVLADHASDDFQFMHVG